MGAVDACSPIIIRETVAALGGAQQLFFARVQQQVCEATFSFGQPHWWREYSSSYPLPPVLTARGHTEAAKTIVNKR